MKIASPLNWSAAQLNRFSDKTQARLILVFILIYTLCFLPFPVLGYLHVRENGISFTAWLSAIRQLIT